MAKHSFIAVLVLLTLCVTPLTNEGLAQQASGTVAATDVGDAQAQFESGLVYLHDGDSRDLRKARQLFSKAAGQGHRRAAYYAAVMFDQGLGGARNSKKAMQLYFSAAEAGDPDAMFTLSKLHDEAGGDLKRDSKKAREWYGKAINAWENGATGDTHLRHPK